MGYKRLTWAMVDEDVAYLRPWQVYDILGKHDLLCHTARPAPKPLKRPPEPDSGLDYLALLRVERERLLQEQLDTIHFIQLDTDHSKENSPDDRAE